MVWGRKDTAESTGAERMFPGLVTIEQAYEIFDEARAMGKRVVLTNGVFDLLHVGHIRYLQQAKALGDMLVIGLNSDASVTKIKGANRPVIPAVERAELLLALRYVDLVVIFDESTAERLVMELRPDVYVKGGDYRVEQLPEATIVQTQGGQVRILELVEGRSTSELIQAIRQRF